MICEIGADNDASTTLNTHNVLRRSILNREPQPPPCPYKTVSTAQPTSGQFPNTSAPRGIFPPLETLGLPHLAEKVHHARVDNKQDTAAGSQPENLGQEALVQGAEAFLLGNGGDTGPRPVVLGGLAWDLDGVLDAALDDVEGYE